MKPASCFLLVAALASLPAVAGTHRERVVDPARLTAMGFAADATNVWRLVDDEVRNDDGARDLLGIPPGHSYSMDGDDFRMAATFSAYDTQGNGYLYCPAGASVRVASAAVNLPADRRVEYLDLWGVDNSAGDILGATLFATCHASDAAGSPGNTVLAEVDSNGISGAFFRDSAIPEYFADPEHCAYTINLVFGEDGTCEGDALLLHKVRVTWFD